MGSVRVHPTAIIHPAATLGDDVEVGPFAIIEENVAIGRGTRIGSSVRVDPYARIGEWCQLHHGAVVGGIPQDLKFRGETSYCVVGDRTTIREYATVHRGTGEGGETRIGNDCLIMAYAHVAHDCRIGDHVIIANSVNMAGHVTIEDYAIVGGIVAIHQFVRIGCHSVVGGASRAAQDVLPYVRAAGNPLRISGLNTLGLSRRGFSAETKAILGRAYRILFRQGLNTSQALEKIRADLPQSEEIIHLVRFVETSTRGLSK